MAYWLMKSEPAVYGIDDLQAAGTDCWDGVRNYQARNMLRDQMQPGDLAFFYHSNTKVPGIVGIMAIACAGYPDPSAFDPESKYYDPRSDAQTPRWFMVDVRYQRHLQRLLALTELKRYPELAELPLVRKGNRLSIMPVTPEQWEFMLALEGMSVTPASG